MSFLVSLYGMTPIFNVMLWWAPESGSVSHGFEEIVTVLPPHPVNRGVRRRNIGRSALKGLFFPCKFFRSAEKDASLSVLL